MHLTFRKARERERNNPRTVRVKGVKEIWNIKSDVPEQKACSCPTESLQTQPALHKYPHSHHRAVSGSHTEGGPGEASENITSRSLFEDLRDFDNVRQGLGPTDSWILVCLREQY